VTDNNPLDSLPLDESYQLNNMDRNNYSACNYYLK